MINILHIIDTTGPGGAETLFIELNKEFNNQDYTSYAIILGPGYVEDKLKEFDLNYYIIPGKGSFNFSYLFKLIKIIRSKKINLIHAHLFGSNIYASIAGLITGTPVISTFHGLVDINVNDKLLKLKIKIVNMGSQIISVSQKILNHLVQNTQLKNTDIKLVKNGVHLSNIQKPNKAEFFKKYNLPDDAILIGCLGNVRPAKDYATAIKAIDLAIQKQPKLHLLIAGATDHRLHEEYLKLITDRQLASKVTFIGFIKDPLLFLSHLDIYLISSISEGQPISMFQAMNCKLPIIATQCGVEDILSHNKTALLVPPESPDLIADSIVSLIKNSIHAKELATNAYKLVNEQFDIHSMFEEYEQLYLQLIRK